MSEPDAGARTGEEGAASESAEESFLDRRFMPVLRESTLLPIWIVVAGHIIAFVVPMLLLGLRDRRFSAQAALVLLLFLSGGAVRAEIRQRGGLGILSVLVVVLWAASGAVAVAADRYGIF